MRRLPGWKGKPQRQRPPEMRAMACRTDTVYPSRPPNRTRALLEIQPILSRPQRKHSKTLDSRSVTPRRTRIRTTTRYNYPSQSQKKWQIVSMPYLGEMADQSTTPLLTTPVSQWETDRIVVSHWVDGPMSGYCRLANPECAFFFHLAAERHNPDGLDDRIFSLSMVESATFELAWSSPITGASSSAGDAMRTPDLSGLVSPPHGTSNLLIRTPDMRTFLGCWVVPDWQQVADLFARVGI